MDLSEKVVANFEEKYKNKNERHFKFPQAKLQD